MGALAVRVGAEQVPASGRRAGDDPAAPREGSVAGALGAEIRPVPAGKQAATARRPSPRACTVCIDGRARPGVGGGRQALLALGSLRWLRGATMPRVTVGFGPSKPLGECLAAGRRRGGGVGGWRKDGSAASARESAGRWLGRRGAAARRPARLGCQGAAAHACGHRPASCALRTQVQAQVHARIMRLSMQGRHSWAHVRGSTAPPGPCTCDG